MMTGETIAVLRAILIPDPYTPTRMIETWGNPLRFEVRGVLVEPRPSGEPTRDARNSVVSGYTLYLLATVDITAKDRVEVRGTEHKVIGEPADWRLGNWRPGRIVQVERVAG